MRKVLAVLGALLLMVGAGAALRRPAPGAEVSLELAPGSSTTQVGRLLEQEGVVRSALVFRMATKLRGLDGRLQAGRYTLRRHMGVWAALDAFKSGPAGKSVAVTIPEGYTLRQIAARVGTKTQISRDDFLKAAASAPVRPGLLPEGVDSLEGTLFPETYVVGEKETADRLVSRMVATFEQAVSKLDFSVAAGKGLTPYQVLIVASLVEREAKIPDDRDKIAAVIYNRLAKGMPLQVDATVLYDLPAHKVPTQADLRRQTPYNTYLRKGLPPTPIANPGLLAIQAALRPADISALYYVVIDPSGRHGFATTLQEHERLKRLRPAETRGG